MADRITLDGISVSYGGVAALKAVSLSLANAEHLGVLGPNGAGKSTLISAVIGSTRIESGRILGDGRPVSTAADWRRWRKRVGVLPQRFGFDPRMTAQETLEYAAWLHSVNRSAKTNAVRTAFGQVGLSPSIQNQRMGTLSGGMVQRVGLACALVHNPALLLMDEPTSGLDIEQRSSFRRLVRDLDSDAAVIMCSHWPEDITATCDRVLIVSNGMVHVDSSIAAICGLQPQERATGSMLESAYFRTLAGTNVA